MKNEENRPIWVSKKRVPSRTPFWPPRVPSRTSLGDPFLTLLGAENVIITVVLRLGPFWGGALFDIVALLFYDFLKCRFRETMRWKCYKKQWYFNYFKNDAFKQLRFFMMKKRSFGPHFGHSEPQKCYILLLFFDDFAFSKICFFCCFWEPPKSTKVEHGRFCLYVEHFFSFFRVFFRNLSTP